MRLQRPSNGKALRRWARLEAVKQRRIERVLDVTMRRLLEARGVPVRSFVSDLRRKTAIKRAMPQSDETSKRLRALERRMIAEKFQLSAHLSEIAPEGWEGVVRKMKGKVKNPYALAHWMAGKGYTPRRERDGSYKFAGRPAGMRSEKVYEAAARMRALRAKLMESEDSEASEVFAAAYDPSSRLSAETRLKGKSEERRIRSEETETHRRALIKTAEALQRLLDRHLERFKRAGEAAHRRARPREDEAVMENYAETRRLLKLAGVEDALPITWGMADGGIGYAESEKLAKLYAEVMQALREHSENDLDEPDDGGGDDEDLDGGEPGEDLDEELKEREFGMGGDDSDEEPTTTRTRTSIAAPRSGS